MIVLGAGVAGISLAKKCAYAGLKVALIEKDLIGGRSLNGGGVFIHHIFQTIKAIDQSRNLHQSSIIGDTSSLLIDYPNLIEKYKNKRQSIIDEFIQEIATEHIKLIKGYATLIDRNTVLVNDQLLKSTYIVLANGGKLNIPNYQGLEEAYLNGFAIEPTEISKTTEKPQEIVILGGGRIGYELAYFYVSIGTKVTVITNSILTNNLDDDICEILRSKIKNSLINLVLKPSSVSFKTNEVTYVLDNKSYRINPDRVIIATGYGVNKDILGEVKLDFNENGIITDDTLKTSIDNIYAIGDTNNQTKLSNIAIKEASIAANNIIGNPSKMKYDRFVNALMGIFEYAYIGQSETEVIATKEPYYVARFSLTKEKRLYANIDTPLIKIILSKVRDEILGIHIVGNEASDEIAQLYDLLQPKNDNSRLMIPIYSKLNEINSQVKLIKRDYHTKLINHMYSVYQKIYSNQDNKVVGFESLSRFIIDDQVRQTLPIIEMLENSGYIRDLDKKSVENAIHTLKKLNRDDVDVSINISSHTLLNTPSKFFFDLITFEGLKPNNITFEITERQMINHEKVLEAMINLRNHGFRVSLDDFSVGHASLVILDKFPFDEVKIDRELLPNDENDLNAISTYKYLVDLIKHYDVKIVAEGIETAFHYDFIKTLNVDYLQGYYLAKPEVI